MPQGSLPAFLTCMLWVWFSYSVEIQSNPLGLLNHSVAATYHIITRSNRIRTVSILAGWCNEYTLCWSCRMHLKWDKWGGVEVWPSHSLFIVEKTHYLLWQQDLIHESKREPKGPYHYGHGSCNRILISAYPTSPCLGQWVQWQLLYILGYWAVYGTFPWKC